MALKAFSGNVISQFTDLWRGSQRFIETFFKEDVRPEG
jgi:hypothetical protein